MTRFFLTFSGVLCFGAIGAFFLFVPPLLIATVFIALVVLLLTGLVWSYCLLQSVPVPNRIDPKD
ncbi:MAG: hypothetical protein LAO55_22770 [Acidobacteriia bacterium]|jgi:hypothetical protein|nr:hypothetical protein [Terriglobia bacterium]